MSTDESEHAKVHPLRRAVRAVVAAFRDLRPDERVGKLGDFTVKRRMVIISLIAVLIGALSAVVTLILLRLIGLFTNLFFFQRFNTALTSPENADIGLYMLVVPVIGGFIVGLMARYGSERIRGHGIPEAIEAILISGSRVQPRVAFLKPTSSAIAIGSGGPFGAEGPIIMSGGAFGSLIAQFIQVTSAERKTLLVAGAAGGMSATFVAPIASVLLAVELLLFEWKPRSLIPVACSSITATVLRRYIIGEGPLFPIEPHSALVSPAAILGCVIVGLLAGVAAIILTMSVYASEDAFHRLPIHWMWWPAIGGLIIGVGGLIFPRALGVGYSTIDLLIRGEGTLYIIIGVLLVKTAIWALSLGSGTSGGVVAPILLIGSALGGLEALFLPGQGAGFWPLVSMGAVMAGTMGVPFTGAVFAVELTRDVNMLLPIFIAAIVAQGFTALVLRRSILTEKISRRGYHLSREYASDPLEILSVREAMQSNVGFIPADAKLPTELVDFAHGEEFHASQRLYPVINDKGKFIGIVPGTKLESYVRDPNANGPVHEAIDLAICDPVVAYPDEPLRAIFDRMADTGLTRFPVVERGRPDRLLGMVSLNDMLKARARNLESERRRERILPLRVFSTISGREHDEPQDEPGDESHEHEEEITDHTHTGAR